VEVAEEGLDSANFPQLFENSALQGNNKYNKLAIATLNCYVKPNSTNKMLMIGPAIVDL
jgi:hypothetical protein